MGKQLPFGTRYSKKHKTPEQSRAYLLQRKYGLTVEEYELMSAFQGDRCAICDKTPDKPLVVDHCHVSGKVRALLCDLCNMGLGAFKDDRYALERAIAYVSKYAE